MGVNEQLKPNEIMPSSTKNCPLSHPKNNEAQDAVRTPEDLRLNMGRDFDWTSGPSENTKDDACVAPNPQSHLVTSTKMRILCHAKDCEEKRPEVFGELKYLQQTNIAR